MSDLSSTNGSAASGDPLVLKRSAIAAPKIPRHIIYIAPGRSGDLAWQEGIRRAHQTQATLLVIAVINEQRRFPLLSRGDRHDVEQARARRAAVRSELSARAAALAGSISVQVIVTGGDPAAQILRAAERYDADLVLLGRAEADGSRADRLATRVIRGARCATLIVRESPETGVILGGTDLSDAKLPVVTATCREAAARPAGVALVAHSCDPVQSLTWSPFAAPDLADEALREATTEASTRLTHALQCHPRAEPMIVNGPPGPVLVACAMRLNAELLVIGTSGGGGLLAWFHGNVAEHAVRNASCSVMIVRVQRTRRRSALSAA